MKPISYTLLFASALAVASQTAMAATVLFDDFDGGGIGVGDGTSINGGFEFYANGIVGGQSISETPSDAIINTGTVGYGGLNMNSSNSFDASAATSISATWDVTSQTAFGPDADANARLMRLTLADTQGWWPAGLAFRVNGAGEWDFGAETSGTLTSTQIADIADGYTFTMDLSAAGWALTTTGLTTNIASSGAWTDPAIYTGLQTDLYVTAAFQAQSGSPITMNIDSISVAVIPEPGTYALLAGSLALTSVMLRRRRS